MNISNLINELYLYNYVRLPKLGSPLPFMGVGSSQSQETRILKSIISKEVLQQTVEEIHR